MIHPKNILVLCFFLSNDVTVSFAIETNMLESFGEETLKSVMKDFKEVILLVFRVVLMLCTLISICSWMLTELEPLNGTPTKSC